MSKTQAKLMVGKKHVQKIFEFFLIFSFVFQSGCNTVSNPQSEPVSESTITPTTRDATSIAIPATTTSIPTPVIVISSPQWTAESVVNEALFNEIVETQHIQSKIAQLESWRLAWSQGSEPVIDHETTSFYYDIIFDNTNLPKDKYDNIDKKVGVTLNWRDADGVSVRVYIPIDYINTNEKNGVVFQTSPETLPSSESTEYLTLSEQPDMKIVWRGNEWIQIDPNTGKKVMQIQRHSPFTWEKFDPSKRLNELLDIVFIDEHEYKLANGTVVKYSFDTNISNADRKVSLDSNFPNAEKIMAERLYNAMDVSAKANGGEMRFIGYWDGESTPRYGKLPISTGKPVHFVFGKESDWKDIAPTHSISSGFVINVRTFVVDGEITMLLSTDAPTSGFPAGNSTIEVDEMTFALCSLYGSKEMLGYTRYFYTDRDFRKTKILKLN